MSDLQLSVLVLVCVVSVFGFTYTAYAIATLNRQLDELRKDVNRLRRWYHD